MPHEFSVQSGKKGQPITLAPAKGRAITLDESEALWLARVMAATHDWTAAELFGPSGDCADRARRVLLALSDPTRDPIEKAPGKSACGAHKSP
jgi:hypothetical protein